MRLARWLKPSLCRWKWLSPCIPMLKGNFPLFQNTMAENPHKTFSLQATCRHMFSYCTKRFFPFHQSLIFLFTNTWYTHKPSDDCKIFKLTLRHVLRLYQQSVWYVEQRGQQWKLDPLLVYIHAIKPLHPKTVLVWPLSFCPLLLFW